MLKLKFKGAQHLTEYHGLIDIKAGEVQRVDKAIAQKLLQRFPKLFELVDSSLEDLVDKRGRPPVLLKEVERQFGKSINQLLYERKDKSVREIAKEFGISKSLVAKWRKRYLAN